MPKPEHIVCAECGEQHPKAASVDLPGADMKISRFCLPCAIRGIVQWQIMLSGKLALLESRERAREQEKSAIIIPELKIGKPN